MELLGALSLLAWLAVLLLPGRPWDLRPRAEDSRPADPPDWPSVCAVVPARDEAALLPETLPALLGQDYPGPFRVVVVDDRSQDDPRRSRGPSAPKWSRAARCRTGGWARSGRSSRDGAPPETPPPCCSRTQTSGTMLFVVPPARAATGSWLGGAAWLAMTVAYLPAVRAYRQPWPLAATLPLAGVLYAGMTLDSAIRGQPGARGRRP